MLLVFLIAVFKHTFGSYFCSMNPYRFSHGSAESVVRSTRKRLTPFISSSVLSKRLDD